METIFFKSNAVDESRGVQIYGGTEILQMTPQGPEGAVVVNSDDINTAAGICLAPRKQILIEDNMPVTSGAIDLNGKFVVEVNGEVHPFVFDAADLPKYFQDLTGNDGRGIAFILDGGEPIPLSDLLSMSPLVESIQGAGVVGVKMTPVIDSDPNVSIIYHPLNANRDGFLPGIELMSFATQPQTQDFYRTLKLGNGDTYDYLAAIDTVGGGTLKLARLVNNSNGLVETTNPLVTAPFTYTVKDVAFLNEGVEGVVINEKLTPNVIIAKIVADQLEKVSEHTLPVPATVAFTNRNNEFLIRLDRDSPEGTTHKWNCYPSSALLTYSDQPLTNEGPDAGYTPHYGFIDLGVEPIWIDDFNCFTVVDSRASYLEIQDAENKLVVVDATATELHEAVAGIRVGSGPNGPTILTISSASKTYRTWTYSTTTKRLMMQGEAQPLPPGITDISNVSSAITNLGVGKVTLTFTVNDPVDSFDTVICDYSNGILTVVTPE